MPRNKHSAIRSVLLLFKYGLLYLGAYYPSSKYAEFNYCLGQVYIAVNRAISKIPKGNE